MTKCKNCGYDEARHDAPAGSNTGTALCPGFASNTTPQEAVLNLVDELIVTHHMSQKELATFQEELAVRLNRNVTIAWAAMVADRAAKSQQKAGL